MRIQPAKNMKTVIIGGGASGISAAIRLKQLNSDMSVTVIEHLGEIMKKIYATGNGRCNIANKNAEHYDEVKDFLSSLGLFCVRTKKAECIPTPIRRRVWLKYSKRNAKNSALKYSPTAM